MLRFLKVTGRSLQPAYDDGDYVLVSRLPALLGSIHTGDVVVLRQPAYGTLIKQVERVSPDKDEIFVTGLDPFSVDSRNFGPVSRKDLLGKVIWHIRRKP